MGKQTPLFNIHKQAGAKIIDFGGFEMPVQYSSIRQEHNAVREAVGMFDVSHMGEFFVSGDGARDLLQHVTVNDVDKLEPGKAQYTCMCYEDGGIVDDLIIYMLDENRYMMVVNAANRQKDWEWVNKNNKFGATLEDKSDDMCLLAVQGPKAVDTLQVLAEQDLSKIGFYRFDHGTIAGYDNILISGTGYTGEKGFELYFDRNEVDPAGIWKAIMEAGKDYGIEPAGLGARDTLRLEMGLALYGNDISAETNPLEARLGWLTKLDKGEFMGRGALQKVKQEGIGRKLMGFALENKRAIPRKDYQICDSDGNEIGIVTSGSLSITLDKPIGMGYMPVDVAKEGENIFIQIRKKLVEATVTKPPFIKK